MSTKFQYFGFGGFLITSGKGTNVLIDPYLDDNKWCPIKTNNLEKVDLILLSHPAFDHIGDTAKIALKFKCPVICGVDSKQVLLEDGVPEKQIVQIVWGLTVKFSGIMVRAVESHHGSSAKLKNGTIVTGVPLGFIIYMDDGTRVYNSSDTAIFSDMKLFGELYKPNVGLINITMDNVFDFFPTFYSGEMSAYEAALAAKWLGLEYAVACHYVDVNGPDVQRFIRLLNDMTSDNEPYVKPVALAPGEIFEYNQK